VAPGFIDVHTHADDLAEKPAAENFVRMGVTTIVAGNCGSSAVDVAGALGQIRTSGASLNFATLVGHNSVRREVMGTERRPPTADELQRMKMLVTRAMAEGAVGFSTGLQYVPGTYAETAEILELARAASARGGLYATHMRNEGTELEKAVAEAIAIGEAASCPVEISHLKVDSPRRWGASEKALAMIDEARERGLDVRADQYAYTAASSNLGIRLPSWVLEGGQDAINKRLDDPATWERIKSETIALFSERGFTDLSFAVVASYAADPSYNGRSIRQIAETVKGSAAVDAQLEVVRTMMREGGASMVYHLMSEDDIARIMRHPQVSIASDSWVLVPGQGVPHPRGYGNNPRVLGRYVRELGILSLEEAVRKMTSLPAGHFGFARRGTIAGGYAADLVIFDPARIGDPSTYDRPHQHAAGVRDVLVNGVPVVRDGRYTGARPGQILKREK
jgi:N-acyl-D-amino-acid deacylase